MNKEEINLLNLKLYLNYYKKDITDSYIRCIDNIVFNNDVLNDLSEQLYIDTLKNHIKLQQKVNQLENKYNKALEFLVDFNLPCEQRMFMDRYSEWCELNCSVNDECYKKCWNKYIESELEKSKSE